MPGDQGTCEVNDDTVGNSCHCDRSCHVFNDCCADILELPCPRKSVILQVFPPSHAVCLYISWAYECRNYWGGGGG